MVVDGADEEGVSIEAWQRVRHEVARKRLKGGTLFTERGRNQRGTGAALWWGHAGRIAVCTRPLAPTFNRDDAAFSRLRSHSSLWLRAAPQQRRPVRVASRAAA